MGAKAGVRPTRRYQDNPRRRRPIRRSGRTQARPYARTTENPRKHGRSAIHILPADSGRPDRGSVSLIWLRRTAGSALARHFQLDSVALSQRQGPGVRPSLGKGCPASHRNGWPWPLVCHTCRPVPGRGSRSSGVTRLSTSLSIRLRSAARYALATSPEQLAKGSKTNRPERSMSEYSLMNTAGHV